MFVENYRKEEMAVSESRPIPYRQMTQEEIKLWRWWLPETASSHVVKILMRAETQGHPLGDVMLTMLLSEDAPIQVREEIARAAKIFDRVEIWQQKRVDPLAVGINGSNHYMIARWGGAKLVSVRTLKFHRACARLFPATLFLSGLGMVLSMLGAFGD